MHNLRNEYIFLNTFSVGLDEIFDVLSAFGEEYFTYDNQIPPFNVKKVDGTNYQIELAIPGYSRENVSVDLTGNVLTVKATPDDIDPEDDDVTFYSGVADGDVYVKFLVPKFLEVKEVVLYKGVLVIKFKDIVKNRKEGILKIKKGKRKETPPMPENNPVEDLPEPIDDEVLTEEPVSEEVVEEVTEPEVVEEPVSEEVVEEPVSDEVVVEEVTETPVDQPVDPVQESTEASPIETEEPVSEVQEELPKE